MSTPGSSPEKGRGRKFAKIGAAVVLAAAAVGAAAMVWAHAPWRHHGGEHIAAHFENRFRDVLENAGVADAQQDQILQILKTTAQEMHALRDQHHGAHAELHELLSAAAIDRTRLEALRAEQIRLADEASKRIANAIADAAEVLTPEQRAAVAAEMEKRHRRWRPDEE